MPNTAQAVPTQRSTALTQQYKIGPGLGHPMLTIEKCTSTDSCLTLNGLPETKLSAIARAIIAGAENKKWNVTAVLHEGKVTFIAKGNSLHDMCKVVRTAVASLKEHNLLDPNTKVLAHLL